MLADGCLDVMAVAAEVACVLSISHRADAALLAETYALARSLPLTLAALRSGHISWQHARTMVDQTASLDPAGAAALEAHFLDPDTGNPAPGCPVGEMPAHRFKAEARIWRERHHPETLEGRHASSAADRRVEYTPDCDGMAWISAYLPATPASAVWNRTTAIARGLQGQDEHRALSQLRADVLSAALLTGGGNQDLQGGDKPPLWPPCAEPVAPPWAPSRLWWDNKGRAPVTAPPRRRHVPLE